DQGGHLSRADLLAVRRHVAPARGAVADLVNQLVARQPRADRRQVGAALAAAALEGVAIPAGLVLEHEGALQPERRAALYQVLGHRLAAPGGHLRRPGRGDSLVGQNAERRVGYNHNEHGYRPAAGGALTPVAHERDEEQDADEDHREDEDDE